MAKYTPKSLNETQWWWRNLKGPEKKAFNKIESRAALIYEVAARANFKKLGLDPVSKPSYPIKNRNWRALPKKTKNVITKWFLPRVPLPLLVYEFGASENGLERAFVNRHKWSAQFRVRVNLDASTPTILNQVKELLTKVGMKNGISRPPSRPPSFRVVELMDRQLMGENLKPHDRFYVNNFVARNEEDLILTRCLVAALRGKPGTARKFKRFVKPDFRFESGDQK